MKFKVIKEFVLNGVVQKLDSVIELDNKMASLKSIQGNIEKIAVTPVVRANDGSVLSTIKPGETLTPEQKEKLAKENAKVSEEAHRLAAEQRANDLKEGKVEPVVKTVADALKDKLVNENFDKKQ